MTQEIFLKGGKKTTFTTQEVHFVFKINEFTRVEGNLKEYYAFIQDLNYNDTKHEIKTYKSPNGNWFNFDP